MVKIDKVLFVVLFLIISFIVVFCSSTTIAEEKKLCPDIVAKDIYGNDFQLSKSTDKPKVIEFMRVYCGGRLAMQTIEQFKQLAKLYQKYKDKIVFVTITISSCKASDLKKIADINGIKWTFINDYSDYNLDIIQAYSEYLKNLSDPALIFVNKTNEVVCTSNFCDDKKLQECINSILETKKGAEIPIKKKIKK